MPKFNLIDQIEENIQFNLVFPYHIHFDKLIGNQHYNTEYPNSYHCHKFEDVLKKVYFEPKAFYLTEEDKKYYSEQEIVFIEKLKENESKKLDNGMEIINLDLEEKTIELINTYKKERNLTFEEAVIELLTKYIESNNVNRKETNI